MANMSGVGVTEQINTYGWLGEELQELNEYLYIAHALWFNIWSRWFQKLFSNGHAHDWLYILIVRFCQSISAGAAQHLRITSRLCLLLIICFARSVYFCVEQPRSSVMKHFKHLKELATMLSDLGNDVIKFRIQNLWLDKHIRISVRWHALY